MSVFAPVRIGEGTGLLVFAIGRVSEGSISVVWTSVTLPRNDSRSGLTRGLLLDFPGLKASLNFRPGEMPRIDLLTLFLRPERDSDGRPRVFARPARVGEGMNGSEVVGGSEGECVMEGMLNGARAGLSTAFSDGVLGCC
jgi:hypothetical protein